MKSIFILLVFLLVCAVARGASPVVSNVVATPQAGGTVVITYNLSDSDTASLYVTLAVSTDGGSTYSVIPTSSTLSGHVGPGVSRGTGKRIVWYSCLTFPGVTGGSYKVRVTADDSTGGGGGGGGTPGQMVYIPAGSFLMGTSNVGNDAVYHFSGELPQHSVYLSGYWIGKFEVTRGEYRAFMNAGGYSNSAYWSSAGWSWKVSNGRTEPYYWAANQYWDGVGFTQTESHPVVGVSYYEAEAYCSWAGGHLATEAQWEKAARWDGHPRVYPWGDVWDYEKCNNLGDHNAAGGGYGRYQTAPVGSYPSGSSPYGCQDMAGNVSEWCQDWYKSYPGSSNPSDYTGEYRVARGDGWFSTYHSTRCAYRDGFYAYRDWYWIGFRLAR